MASEKRSNNFLELVPTKNGLKITLSAEGKTEIADLRESHPEWTNDDYFIELFDTIRGNSEYDFHSDGGEAGFGLTNAPMITDGYYPSESGRGFDTDYPESAEVYYYDNYMITDFVEQLEKHGEVFFNRIDSKATGGEVNIWRTGKKRFDVQYNIGKAKYVVNYHKGGEDNKHKDGSDFFDIKMFQNKKDFEQFQKQLLSEGYVKQMKSGGTIKNQYDKLKSDPRGYGTSVVLWNTWNKKQRIHFLDDHWVLMGDDTKERFTPMELSEKKWEELPIDVVTTIIEHIKGGQYKTGGKIPNNYEGKTSEQIWNAWTEDQRSHFLSDHTEALYHKVITDLSDDELNELMRSHKNNYNKLSQKIQNVISNHIREGQYAGGGQMPSSFQNYYTQHGGLFGGSYFSDTKACGGYMKGGGKIYAQKKVAMTKRGKQIDGKVKAQKAGWRVSKTTGDKYFESRSNRSDKDLRKKL